MLTRDPFQPPAKHAKPRRTGRLALAAVGAAVAMAGGITMAATHAHAATSPLGATVTHAAENAAARFTPSPAPIIRAHGSRAADGRVCRALAVFDAAGIPTSRELRNLAAAGIDATRAYRLADGQLIMALVGHKPFYAADTELQRLCGQD
jgi:hypothetical protein